MLVRALGRDFDVEVATVWRDPMLRWMPFYPFLFAIGVRLLVPPLERVLLSRLDFDLTPFYDLLVSMLLIAFAVMIGAVTGFRLLDQRDDGTLEAIRVSPLTLSRFLMRRLGAPVLITLIVAVLATPLAGLPMPGLVWLSMAAIAAALLAPFYALAMAALGANKVQGFALMKANSSLSLLLLVAYLVTPPWQLLFGFLPMFWPAKFYWAAAQGDPYAWIWLAATFPMVGLWTIGLYRLFLRRLARS